MRSEIFEIFTKNMKKHRLEQKLTQEQLSFRSKLHKNYISDVENGARNISLISIEKIAMGLGIKVEELFK